MGFKHIFKDKSATPAPNVIEEPVVSDDKTPKSNEYTAKITGNAVDGYQFNIYRGTRLYEYGETIYGQANRTSLTYVEGQARKRLAELRKREETTLEKVVR